MTSYFSVADDTRIKQLESAASHIQDPAKKQLIQDMAVRMAQVNNLISKYSNVFNMLATPVMTLLFWLFYKKARYNYVEHLVANLYFVPYTTLFYALLVVPLQKLTAASDFGYLILIVFLLFEIVYRGMAYYQFINRKGVVPLAKALGVSSLTALLWAAGVALLSMTYIRTGFRF